MQSPDRPEFDTQMAVLCSAFDVPCTDARKEAYWKGLQEISLVQFARAIEYLLSQEDWVRIPKPAQIRAALRRMRAPTPGPVADDGFRGDAWDMAANRHLLAHLMERMRTRKLVPGKPPSRHAMGADAQTLKVLGLDLHNLDASAEFTVNVQRLVEYKNAWAQDMRDEAVNGEVPVKRQRETWAQCMARAESELRP